MIAVLFARHDSVYKRLAGCDVHDYSYLGTDYKERGKIKLKFDRWVANFEALPVQEQNMRIDYLNSTKFKTA